MEPEIKTLEDLLKTPGGQEAVTLLVKSIQTGEFPTYDGGLASRTLDSRDVKIEPSEMMKVAIVSSEVRKVIVRLRKEVFRLGLEVERAYECKCDGCETMYDEMAETCPNCESTDISKPREEDKTKLLEMVKDANRFGQPLSTVVQEAYDDLNITDNAWLAVIPEDWTTDEEGYAQPVGLSGIVRVDPALIEFAVDDNGVPGQDKVVCPKHPHIFAGVEDGSSLFQKRREDKTRCTECNSIMEPAFYKFNPKSGSPRYFTSERIIHFSKFSPGLTGGISPIVTLLEKLQIIMGGDHAMWRQWFKREIPRGVVVTYTSDPENFEEHKNATQERMKRDPEFIPWFIVKPPTGSNARTEFIRFHLSPSEMSYIEVREEIRQEIAGLYEVSLLFLGETRSTGLRVHTQELEVTERIIEDDQSILNENVFSRIVALLGAAGWILRLKPARGQTEDKRLEQQRARAEIARIMVGMGFGASWDPETETYSFTTEQIYEPEALIGRPPKEPPEEPDKEVGGATVKPSGYTFTTPEQTAGDDGDK